MIPTYPQWILIEVWRFSFHHLDSHDAQGPDVDFGSVGFARHDFRSHPIWRPHHGAPLILFGSDLGTESKVRCRVGDEKHGLETFPCLFNFMDDLNGTYGPQSH